MAGAEISALAATPWSHWPRPATRHSPTASWPARALIRWQYSVGPDVPTFEEAATKVIEIHRPNWRNAKHVAQWTATLRAYAYPKIGNKRVDQVSTADVMAVLLPIWNDKHETARRVRQRIGTVMKWAVAQGLRQDNPAGDAIGAALAEERRHPAASSGAASYGSRGCDRGGAPIGCVRNREAGLRIPGPDRLPLWRSPACEVGMRST